MMKWEGGYYFYVMSTKFNQSETHSNKKDAVLKLVKWRERKIEYRVKKIFWNLEFCSLFRKKSPLFNIFDSEK